MIDFRRFLIMIVGFILIATSSYSQKYNDWQHSIQKLTTQHGLPSLEVYFVHEDSKGYLWFGTDHGLVRFNGYEFNVYTEKDGLSDNTVFMLLEDSIGGFWLICKDGKLVYYDKKSFRHFIAKSQDDFYKNANHYELFNDTLYVSDNERSKFYSISLPDKIVEKNWIAQTDDFLENHGLLNINGRSLIYRKEIESNLKKKRDSEIKVVTTLNPVNKYEKIINIDNTRRLLINKNQKLSLRSAKLLLLNQDSIVYEMDMWKSNKGRLITTHFNAGDGNIHLSTNTGVYLFDALEGKVKEHFFQGEYITSSLRDKEGNLWVSSKDNGVWFLRSNHIKTIRPNAVEGKNKFTRIRIFQDNLFASDISGQIYKLNKDYSLFAEIDADALQSSWIRESFDFEVDSFFNFYLGTKFSYYDSKSKSITNIDSEENKIRSVKTLQHISGNRMLIGTNNGIKIVDQAIQKVFPDLKASEMASWCNALFEDRDKVLWLGMTNGLFRVLKDSIVPYKNHQNDLLRKRILSINQNADGSILIGSKGEGLIVLQEDSIWHITEEDGLIGNMVQSVFVHKDSSIWVGTNKGVSKIEALGKINNNQLKITNFTTKKGLPSNMVNDIRAYDGKMWFATSNGLSYIEEEEFKTNSKPLKVYIETLNVEDKDIPFSNEKLELDYFENNIRFNYLAICARCQQDITYKYRLKNFKEDWSYTTNRNVQYTSLDAGTYTFQLLAANEDNVWNDAPIEKTFTIKPHFTKTVWFKSLVAIFLLAFLAFLFYAFYRRQQKKAQLNLKLVKLEQQALRTSMNPHFVFNALNSIQDFINKNDMLEANEYLVKFSHLIRANLEITKTNEVVLKDELKRLELYLSIEKLRFQDKLNYKISVEKSFDASKVLVPVMILQPMVENAIIHGILPKEKGGQVNINCHKINDSQYKILISDDGIGIGSSKSNKQQSHTSLSTDFSKTRLELLSQITLKPYSLNITNLADNSDKSGTLVEFILPI